MENVVINNQQKYSNEQRVDPFYYTIEEPLFDVNNNNTDNLA